jgi:hypothetical protein
VGVSRNRPWHGDTQTRSAGFGAFAVYYWLMLAINPSDPTGTAGAPVSIVDTVTGRVVGRFKTLLDAHKARGILEGTDMTTDPDLFARAVACPCCDGPCDCGPDCKECDCMEMGRGVKPTVSYSTARTVTW